MNCNEQPLKLNVSESMIETCQKAFYSSRFGAFSYDENRIGVATSPIMREIFHYTDLFIKGMTNKKFFLFSGKSSTISAISASFSAEYSSDDFDAAAKSNCSFNVSR